CDSWQFLRFAQDDLMQWPDGSTRLLAVDLGRTNCKVGVFRVYLDHQTLTRVAYLPVKGKFLAARGLDPPIPADGYLAFLAQLGNLLRMHGARDLALALPFPVSYQDGSLGTLGEAGWPEQLTVVQKDLQSAGAGR